MKITIITPGVTPHVMGGMQRHSANLVRHLSRFGVEVDLYHTDFKDAQDLDKLAWMSPAERVNVTSISIPWPRGNRFPGHYIRELKQFSSAALSKYMDRPPADFIIAKSLTGWSFVEARRRGAKLPPIGVNLHGLEMYQPPANVRSLVQASMMRPAFGSLLLNADYSFSYGGRITDIMFDKIGIPKERIFEIPGGVDEDWLVESPSPVSDPIRFIFLGRYERRKGIEELHQAIERNRGWAKGAEFRFVGPIPEEKRLNLDHVSYSGGLSDPQELRSELNRADVLICPSYSEGMPNSILEGMACGLAVIATDVGAVSLAVDRDNGILLDRVTSLGIADAIKHIIGLSSEEIFGLKAASRLKANNFLWSKVTKRTLEKIVDIL
jgi:glycosyltransferase involved in cell wall biosynthesis